MCSRFQSRLGHLTAVAIAGLVAAGCQRTSGAGPDPDQTAKGLVKAGMSSQAGRAAEPTAVVATTTLFPGGGRGPAEDPRGQLYEGVPEHVANGRRYFVWYNCAGCHFNGGGGIGPALMDDAWIYGGRIDQIYDTLLEGRPNGMPSWRGKIPDDQLWEISAYVRSLGAPNAAEGPPGSRQAPDSTPPPPISSAPLQPPPARDESAAPAKS